MKTDQRHRLPSWADWIFRSVVRLFPFDFRADHGSDLERTLRAQHLEARREGGIGASVRLWLDVIRDVVTTAPREHLAILRQDVGYALRSLRRAPVFAVSAVLTLAIGIAAITGMAAVLNAVMFRPLAVDRPEQLVSISNQDGMNDYVSYKDLEDYRAEASVLADAIGFVPRPATLTASGTTERITLELVTDNYFSMLGVRPAAGRLIQPNEGRALGDAPVMVLSYDYWQSRFAGDPSVVGRTVRLGGQPFTIIGVSSPAFRGTESLLRVSAYVPAWMIGAFMSFRLQGQSPFDDRSTRTFSVLARLKPGVSLDQARAALNVRASLLARDYPQTHKAVSLRVLPERQARPNPGLAGFLRIAATVLTGLAGVLVLITSANVANLLMARAATRSREVALRAALGARRGRLARQFLTEGATLALLGCVVAIPFVMLATTALRNFLSNATAAIAFDVDLSLDVRVLAAMLSIAVGAGLVAGLAPALAACRADLGARLKSGARNTSARGGTMRSALVVVQVALSLTLLVSGGLFIRSLDRARHIDLGFEPERMLIATTAPALQGYDFEKRLAFYTAASERIIAIPGVEQAAWIQFPPLGIVAEMAEVVPEPRPSDPDWRAPMAFEADISPDYFATARVRLVEGRSFDERDRTDSTPVVIINQRLASQFWPGQSPLGRALIADGDRVEVVGVVENGKYRNVGEATLGAIFRPLGQMSPVMASVAIRASGSPNDLAQSVRQALAASDPEVAVYDVRPMTEHLDNGNAFFPFRVAAFMTGLFGGMGALLASIGLYGMIAYHVSQRTQEIGVRMALGARAADIIRDVMAQGGRFAAIGIAVGVVLAAGLARLLEGLLLGVSPFDPVTYAAVAGLLVAISVVASFVPARRVTAVDPLVALRAD